MEWSRAQQPTASASEVSHGNWRVKTFDDGAGTLGPHDNRPATQWLCELVMSAVSGRIGEPLRCSRHARTYRVAIDDRRQTAMQGGQLFVKVFDSRESAVRWLFGVRVNSRAGRAARAANRLAAHGFKVAPPLLVAEEKGWGRSVLVTREVAGMSLPVALEVLRGKAPVSKWTMLRSLGEEIGRMHALGFVHGDMTPYNILVQFSSEKPNFVFLDHDRTRRILLRSFCCRSQLRNLVQLGRFDLPGITRADRMRFFRAYAHSRGKAPSHRFARKIIGMLTRRLLRDGQVGVSQARFDRAPRVQPQLSGRLSASDE